MALFRKLFYRKPPDGLLEIGGDRVYVFDRCFSTDVWEEKNYKGYVASVITQLRDHYPDVSILAFNFREGESESLIANDLSEHDVTIMDYPRHYEGCPLLSMEMINHFLRSSESWLSLGQQNVLLLHCEWGGWPVLAFMSAALLIYRRHSNGEQKTLDMIYKQAPHDLLQMQPLNPIPSQLRYLQYVARRNSNTQWPPLDRALTLDCIIIRMIPNCNGKGGCRPIFRIYGQDPFIVSDRSPKSLFSTQKKSNVVHYYKQEECELVKIDINCHIQGDVVLECISLHDDREKMMFRTMFNTSFIQSNILILDRDEVDTLWDAKDQFPKDFRTEVLFSDMDVAASVVPVDLSCFDKKDGIPEEAFAKVQEIINSTDWLNQKGDAASKTLEQITESNLIPEKLGSPPDTIATTKLIDQATLENPQERQELAALVNNTKGLAQSTLEQQVGSSSEAYRSNKQEAMFQLVETKESSASVTSTPVSPHESKTVEHPSLHGKERSKLKEVSSLSEIKDRPLMTNVLMSPTPPPLRTKDQGIVTGKPLSPALTPPALFTPLKDKLDVPSPSQPTPPRDQSTNSIYLKDDATTVSKPDTSLLPLGMPLSPCENDIIAKMEPSLPTFPSGSPSPSGPIPPNIKHLEEKLVSKNGTSPSPPPLPHLVPVLEENSAYVCGTPQTPAPPTPTLKQNLTFSGGLSPPPPPPPPSLPPPTPSSSPCLLPTTPGFTKNCSSISGPPQPPSPPTPPLNERLVSKGGMLPTPPPPPPPPPPLPEQPVKEGFSLIEKPCPPPPPPPPLPEKHVKEDFSLTEKLCPPPPPPLPSSQTSKPTELYAVPPSPPPPSMVSPLKDNNNLPKSVPSVPPPPVPFPKVNNMPASPSPTPPIAPPPSKNYRRMLSSTMTSRSNSTKKLKPLHWLKISRAVQGSFWAEIEKCSYASKSSVIDMPELVYFFSVQNLDQVGSGRNGNSKTKFGQKIQKVQLVDHRRAYNCEIMLSKVKIPLHDMLTSVLALEDSALDIDQVENLIKFCPTKEEIEVLKGYKGEKEKLGRCEQFMLELMQVPRIESKLRVFSFTIQFQSQVSELRNNLNIVNSATDQIRGSSKLKGVLQTILYLGNALNQGTARGSAAGFKLDSLLKLTDTRSWSNKMTLMHYLCKILTDKLPELLDFSKDLSSLEPALKIQLKYLAEEMQAITKGMEKVVDELSMSENDGPMSENFCKALTEFLSCAEGQVSSLAQLFSDVGKNVDSLIIYFGEDPARCPFEQVVSTLMSFQRMFNQALDENRKQLEFERKKAEKEAKEKQSTSASNHKKT
ncbi:formin-like protein 18 [Solanum lycopersicum]|uniref:Formin-like protein n=1 Tax=Solanum lycopersicum TaxID=4081 RepID=A0A3Q7J3X2_SOLLC|nr:formin-like protein 13 [Solanum lycopersicum]XP_010313826.1 formin-like protein 13 [Solanum lycopersicum]